MKLTQIAFALLLAGTSVGFAQDMADTDGDGMLTLAELQAAYPDFTEAQLTEADSDGDGMLNADEMAAATEAGVIPMME